MIGVYQFYSRMIVLVQSSFHTTWASLFEMELEPNSLDWNGNELENELEQEDMKRTWMGLRSTMEQNFCHSRIFIWRDTINVCQPKICVQINTFIYAAGDRKVMKENNEIPLFHKGMNLHMSSFLAIYILLHNFNS